MLYDLIIQDLTTARDIFGPIFTKDQFDSIKPNYHSSGVTSYFGGWHKALSAVKPKKIAKPKIEKVQRPKLASKEEVELELSKLTEKISCREFTNRTGITSTAIDKYYGSWWNALNTVGFHKKSKETKPTRIDKNLTREQVIESLNYCKDHYNRVFTIKEFELLTGHTIRRVTKHFKNWTEALLQVGLEITPTLTKEEAILEVQTKYKETGLVPTKAMFGRDKTVARLFGNYSNLLEEAGLSDAPKNRLPKSSAAKADRKKWKKSKKDKVKQAFIEKYGYPRPIGSKSQEETLSTVIDILGLNENELEKEKTFDWLTNPVTGAPFRVDGYIGRYKLAIEYQSEIHFKEQTWTKHSLQEVTIRDYIKRQILISNGVSLLEIAYFEKKDIESIKSKLAILTGQKYNI